MTVVNGSFRSVFEVFGNEYDETRKTGECENGGGRDYLLKYIYVIT